MLVAAVVFRGWWWELCVRWSRGPLPEANLLLGHSVLFWGRLGKSLQFVAGLPVIFDLIGAGALNEFGSRHVKRLSRAKARITATRDAARLLERLRALECGVKSDLTAGQRGRDTPEYESLLASLVETFDGELICASCRYAMPPVSIADDIVVVGPEPCVYKWECQHGREIFESQVEAAFVNTLAGSDKTAWRNAEYVDRRVERIGSVLLGVLALVAPTYLIAQWTVGSHLPGLMVAIAIGLVILAPLTFLTTQPDKRHRAGAVLAWLWAVVCWLPVPITRSIVWVMHREHPAHPLRWIALGLFIFGSLLDLLAS
ncbi:hypothetical protein [Nocardia sp. MDA0666]|uniref:hypothetical protein n=1 Tax=Nocardia sp. MDA0666 TaxID=2135448 RepID=UPI0011B22115|nr:hypothetical protein [Nocardia sp. MDA0666]